MAYSNDESVIESTIETVAHKVREAYCRLRARVCHLESFAPGPKYDQHWIRCAQQCLARSVDPVAFVEFMFTRMLPYPQISMLYSEHLLSAYSESIPTVEDVVERYMTQVSIFTTSCERIGIEKTIEQGRMSMNSLFIYLAAKANALGHLVENMRDYALAEYMTAAPAYDDLYKEWIPADFKSALYRVQLMRKKPAGDKYVSR